MKNIQFSSLGKNAFLFSLLLGSCLLVLFLITRADIVVVCGFYYVMAAMVINILILLYELIEFLTDVSERKDSGNSIWLMLLNIPIAFLYLFIIFNL
ncbi:hypothetical protein IW15_15075 [Chryseobacterium soli]|uniref:Uncharacterized protein n=1 Tax=Chryseobacterium soli TaxID=445961 RepID=A0A086A4C0_9FLAO|nr:hypothetical protein [Chryseobacterium soli]KFF11534.1 hypothetical protein IW15_15075 [Chryseobacterium soli]